MSFSTVAILLFVSNWVSEIVLILSNITNEVQQNYSKTTKRKACFFYSHHQCKFNLITSQWKYFMLLSSPIKFMYQADSSSKIIDIMRVYIKDIIIAACHTWYSVVKKKTPKPKDYLYFIVPVRRAHIHYHHYCCSWNSTKSPEMNDLYYALYWDYIPRLSEQNR